jgi:hypothetical protein
MNAIDHPEQIRVVPASDTRAELALWRNRLQSLILPPDLSDEDVVGCWLAAKATGRGRLAATTLAQYRTEAEHLFWYARQTGVPISNWGLDEFAAYIGLLQSPAPWAVRKAGVRRGRPTGGPFWGLCLTAQPARPKKSSRRSSTGCATSATCSLIPPPYCRPWAAATGISRPASFLCRRHCAGPRCNLGSPGRGIGPRGDSVEGARPVRGVSV